MTNRIWSALQRTLVQTLALLAPATGRRRATVSLSQPAGPCRTVTGLRLVIRALNPPRHPATPRPYAWRSARDDRPEFDSVSPLVRPYFLAHEQRQRRSDSAYGSSFPSDVATYAMPGLAA